MDKTHEQTDKQLEEQKKKAKKKFKYYFTFLFNNFVVEFSKFNFTKNMSFLQKQNEINKYNRFGKIVDDVTKEIINLNKSTISDINKELKEVYFENYNAIASELGIDILKKSESNEIVKDDQNMFNEIAIDKIKDERNVSRQVEENLLNSIATDKTPKQAYNELKKIYEKNLYSLNTIATTQFTRIENQARFDAMMNSKEPILKVWNTQQDEKVREAHEEAQGQKREIDEPFIVGDEELMYPGDPNGSASNIINCRCFITFIKKS